MHPLTTIIIIALAQFAINTSQAQEPIEYRYIEVAPTIGWTKQNGKAIQEHKK